MIDLILARTGWERIATLGGVREGLDVEAENPAAGEIAFVQVKSSADQHVLDDYVHRFQQRRERYARMIFAVHSPRGRLTAPRELPVQVWTGEKVAELVFPRIYTVCDFRASAALGQRDLSSLRYYLAYLAACSWMAASYGVSLREFDRANWQWSKERSKSEACQCRDAYTTYTPEVEAAAR